MLRRLSQVALLFALITTGCVVDGGGDSSFTIANRSNYVLTAVHVAHVQDPEWGPNLLPDVLFPGEDLIVTDIDCGTYDILVVDDTGVNCELSGVELCFDDDVWVVDDFILDVCAF